MPIYEFVCVKCGDIEEEIRAVGDNDGFPCVTCSTPRVKIASIPAMHSWCTDREFPNLRKDGDGKMSFSSKAQYEGYLKKNNIGELSTDAPVKRPHGNKVVMTDG
jgi:putative FmdB family regulatory protein